MCSGGTWFFPLSMPVLSPRPPRLSSSSRGEKDKKKDDDGDKDKDSEEYVFVRSLAFSLFHICIVLERPLSPAMHPLKRNPLPIYLLLHPHTHVTTNHQRGKFKRGKKAVLVCLVLIAH